MSAPKLAEFLATIVLSADTVVPVARNNPPPLALAALLNATVELWIVRPPFDNTAMPPPLPTNPAPLVVFPAIVLLRIVAAVPNRYRPPPPAPAASTLLLLPETVLSIIVSMPPLLK